MAAEKNISKWPWWVFIFLPFLLPLRKKMANMSAAHANAGQQPPPQRQQEKTSGTSEEEKLKVKIKAGKDVLKFYKKCDSIIGGVVRLAFSVMAVILCFMSLVPFVAPFIPALAVACCCCALACEQFSETAKSEIATLAGNVKFEEEDLKKLQAARAPQRRPEPSYTANQTNAQTAARTQDTGSPTETDEEHYTHEVPGELLPPSTNRDLESTPELIHSKIED